MVRGQQQQLNLIIFTLMLGVFGAVNQPRVLTAQEALTRSSPATNIVPASAAAASPNATVPPDSWWTSQPQLKQVPVQDRENFWKNWQTWQQLTPEQRQQIRKNVSKHKDMIRQEAVKVLERSGLTLDADRKEWFILRYIQERRQLERSLKRKMQIERARRLPLIEEQLGREFRELQGLKKEFIPSSPSTSKPSASPSSTNQPTPAGTSAGTPASTPTGSLTIPSKDSN